MPDTIVPRETIADAVTALQAGGVVVFPTDTAYGLGCDFENQLAIKRILQIKGRQDQKFTIIATSLEQAAQFFPGSFLPGSKAVELAERYWPGPLSIVVSEQFSVRVPDNAIARALVQAVGKPLIATSANKTGQQPVYILNDAQQQLGADNVDAWVDGGELPQQPPSTIIRIQMDDIEIIRQGPIKI